MRPTRPPAGFVLVTRTRWSEFSRALWGKPGAFMLKHEGRVVAWRNASARYVDPTAYKAVLATWPDGYWPE